MVTGFWTRKEHSARRVAFRTIIRKFQKNPTLCAMRQALCHLTHNSKPITDDQFSASHHQPQKHRLFWGIEPIFLYGDQSALFGPGFGF